MKGRLFVVVLAVLVIAAVAGPQVSVSDTGTVMPPVVATTPLPQSVTVVRVEEKHPRRMWIVRSRFVPWAEPSVEQAHEIAAVEAARFGVSLEGLSRRINCESSWRWNNEYAGHYGIGQFLPSTYSRGVGTLGARDVEIREVTERAVWVHRVAVMSDGSRKLLRRWRVRQVVIHLKRGMLPRRPPLEHGWVQERIMAEALAGRSAVSSGEWTCGA